jgi:hypothetical protein
VNTTRWIAATVTCAVLAVAYVLVGPIAQDPCYHDFADRRLWLGVPNFADVTSNLPITLAGAWGLIVLADRRHAPFVESWEATAQWIFALGVFTTGFGSAYYHWAPTNETLIWDRLPMTLFFMPFFAVTLGERVSMQLGKRLLAPLVLAGGASVWWWAHTEAAGAGDLRPYALVQFVPVVVIPILLWKRPGPYTHTRDLFWAVGWYGLAKVFEALDKPIYGLGLGVSGHTLKHLASGAAAAMIVANLARRGRRLEA